METLIITTVAAIAFIIGFAVGIILYSLASGDMTD